MAVLALLLMPHLARGELLPASFAYVLQADALAQTKSDALGKLVTCNRDWLVLDAVFAAGTPWFRADLDALRAKRPGRRFIAYLSIGEAEDYRPYWRKEWGMHGKLTAAAPRWLGVENPEWKGNYRVKYWQPDWQRLILASVEQTMAQGFDGVYLDIVDGFETFEQNGQDFVDDRVNPETKQSYRRDMVDWVKRIAGRARAGHPTALVIPQNGSQLLTHPDFLAAISAIGIEDLFTNGDEVQPKSHTREVLAHLKSMQELKKPILIIEYPKSEKRRTLTKQQAQSHGFRWLLTDRQLKTLGESGGAAGF